MARNSPDRTWRTSTASDMTGPRDGEEGGPQEPVLHSTIDNAEAVHELIVRKIDERLG